VGDRAHSQVCLAVAPGGTTFVAGHHVIPPLAFTRAFHVDTVPAGLCSVILQSTTGALLPGDDVALTITAGAGAQAHVTTQGATAVHGGGAPCRFATHLSAGPRSLVEYRLGTAVLFPGAAFGSSLSVELGDGAAVLAHEAFATHDPSGGGGSFTHLETDLTVTSGGRDTVTSGGRELCVERFRLRGDNPSRCAPGVLGRWSHHATAWVLGSVDAGVLGPDLRAALAGVTGAVAAVSVLPNGAGLGVRVVAGGGHPLAAALHQVWVAARVHVTGHAPDTRRTTGLGDDRLKARAAAG
jgi:urease accessory protein